MPKIKIKRAPKGGKSIKGFSKRPIKGPKKPIPQARRESSSSLSSPADLSDEHGYSAVDDVSDSDDDDEDHVFAAEEKHIISHERHRQQDVFSTTPRPDFVSVFMDQDDEAADADNDESDDEDISPSQQQGMQSFSSDIELDDAADESSDDSESWNGFALEDEATVPVETSPAADLGTPTQRHVRFTGVPDSDSESDETEDDHDDFFPDIFVAQQSLDPNFRREIERDDDDDDDSSVALSFWDHTEAAEHGEPWEYDQNYKDAANASLGGRRLSIEDRFNGHDGPLAEWDEGHVLNSAQRRGSDSTIGPATEPTPLLEHRREDSLEEESDDGYDSDDDGDTTDDDQPVLISRKEPLPRQQDTAADAPSAPTPEPDKKSGESKPAAGRLPLRSSGKPICVLNPHTRKMMIFTPRKKRHLQQLPTDYFSLSKMAPDGASVLNPALNPELSLDMMSLWQMAGQSNQLYFEPTMKSSDVYWSLPLGFGNAPSEESFLDDGEDDLDEEKNLDIDDFIIYDGNCEDDNQEADIIPADSEDGNNQSRRSSTATGAEHTLFTGASGDLLDHLTNTRSVGAFRINQMQRKHILNGEATEDSIDFSNSYTVGALRGLKHGSLSGANTPLTPERRHKKRPVKSSLGGSNLKRKASGMATDSNLVHKKHRSISDLPTMSV
ncbi:hypothetical protein BD289DRAFT_481176 [Coniella lustricola]|uniref:Uncharacterized protein n=1 Tax=Coniella lustricola TaxID=2025994 RepID=A0A2T3AD03_9PEZI|nr:hypothetical protein BD289DRAFT_481176 [Coniella lustricola]